MKFVSTAFRGLLVLLIEIPFYLCKYRSVLRFYTDLYAARTCFFIQFLSPTFGGLPVILTSYFTTLFYLHRWYTARLLSTSSTRSIVILRCRILLRLSSLSKLPLTTLHPLSVISVVHTQSSPPISDYYLLHFLIILIFKPTNTTIQKITHRNSRNGNSSVQQERDIPFPRDARCRIHKIQNSSAASDIREFRCYIGSFIFDDPNRENQSTASTAFAH